MNFLFGTNGKFIILGVPILKHFRVSFLKNPKDLDMSYKTNLDFWVYFGRKKKKNRCLITEEIWYIKHTHKFNDLASITESNNVQRFRM